MILISLNFFSFNIKINKKKIIRLRNKTKYSFYCRYEIVWEGKFAQEMLKIRDLGYVHCSGIADPGWVDTDPILGEKQDPTVKNNRIRPDKDNIWLTSFDFKVIIFEILILYYIFDKRKYWKILPKRPYPYMQIAKKIILKN